MPNDSAATTDSNSQGTAGQNGQSATPDAAANNTGANATGAGTQAQNNQGQQQQQQQGQQAGASQEKTFTQDQVNKMIADRLPKAVKAELKKLAGDGDGTLTVEELQKQLTEAKTKTQSFEARESIRDFLSDPANKLAVKPDNFRAIEKLVLPDLEFDNDGKPSNLKEAIEAAKKLAPALFTNSPASINAGAGNDGVATGFDMNAQIRRAAGRG